MCWREERGVKKLDAAHQINHEFIFGNVELEIPPPRKVMRERLLHRDLRIVVEWRETRCVDFGRIEPQRALTMTAVEYETERVCSKHFVSRLSGMV